MDLNELYHNFDQAFLRIYPNFVNEVNKLLKKEEVVAYFNAEGAVTNAKVANGYYRKLLGKTADGSFVAQDFYSRNDVKQSDPFIISNELVSSKGYQRVST